VIRVIFGYIIFDRTAFRAPFGMWLHIRLACCLLFLIHKREGCQRFEAGSSAINVTIGGNRRSGEGSRCM
jgi:hypothetical protein